MKNKIVIFALLIVIVGLGGYWLSEKNSSDSGGLEDSGIRQITESDRESENKIVMTDQGFEPVELNIAIGEEVVFLNDSDEYRWPASDIHPTHEIMPAFDPLEPLAPGEVWSFKFTKSGRWACHDHLVLRFTCVIEVD